MVSDEWSWYKTRKSCNKFSKSTVNTEKLVASRWSKVQPDQGQTCDSHLDHPDKLCGNVRSACILCLSLWRSVFCSFLEEASWSRRSSESPPSGHWPPLPSPDSAAVPSLCPRCASSAAAWHSWAAGHSSAVAPPAGRGCSQSLPGWPRRTADWLRSVPRHPGWEHSGEERRESKGHGIFTPLYILEPDRKQWITVLVFSSYFLLSHILSIISVLPCIWYDHEMTTFHVFIKKNYILVILK